MSTNENEVVIAYIVHISVFLITIWWFWDTSTIVFLLLAGGLSSFLIGMSLRFAIHMAFFTESAENYTGSRKVITFFIALALIIFLVWANSGGQDSLHY